MNLKRLSFILLFVVATITIKAQAIISTESFDAVTFVPAGWSIKPAITPQNPWTRRTASTFPTASPHSGAGFARFASRTVTAGTKQLLVSRPIDYTNRGAATANVSFWMYRDNTSPNYDSMTVWVNSTDTITASAVMLGTIARNRTYMMPDTQATDGWYMYSFAIPTTFTGNMTTHFLFEGTGEAPIANQGAHEYLDDISFEEYPAQCTGMPNVGTIVNNSPLICNGGGTGTLALSAPITGVTGLTYSWQESTSPMGPWTTFGGSTTSVTTNNLTATTYFHCMVNCSFSAMNYTTNVDSILISNNTSPALTVTPSPAAFCAGTSGVTISASGAATYSWSPATGLNMTTGATVIASPAASSQYVVVATDATGCTASTNVNVQVANPPTIGITSNPSDTICSGGTVILSAAQGGGGPQNTYLWSDNITTRRDTVIVTSNMTLSVIVTNQAGCSSYDTISLYALPAQNSNFGYTQVGTTFSFADSTASSSNWYWDFGDGNISTNQNPTYTYSQLGVYTVMFIVTGPCKTDTIYKTVAIYPEATSDISKNIQVVCFPNPATEQLTIQSNLASIESIKIMNLMGEKVKEIKVSTTQSSFQVSVKDLPKGMYTILLQSGKNTVSSKFVKQ